MMRWSLTVGTMVANLTAMSRSSLFLVGLILVVCLPGCDEQNATSQQGRSQIAAQSSLNPEREAFPAQIGDKTLYLEVADTPELSKMGLMHRKSLRPDHGMIFFFDPPQRVGFWMRNTLVPLSIAFLDEQARIVELNDLQPLDESTLLSSSPSIRYAIEMEQGWFLQNGVGIGDVVDLSELPKGGGQRSGQ